MTMIMTSRVKMFREMRQLSQEQIASKLNISQNAYSRLENGQTPLTIDRAEQLSQILDIPTEALISTQPVTLNLNNNQIAVVIKSKGNDTHHYAPSDKQELVNVLQVTINTLRQDLERLQNTIDKKEQDWKEERAKWLALIERLGK